MLKYWTYIQRNIPILSPLDWIGLNGYYDLSFFLSFPQYQLTWLRSIKDWWQLIPDDKLLSNVRLFIADYDETILTQAQIDAFVSAIPVEFNLKQLATPTDAITWIKTNTSLVEITPWVFEISPAITMMWIDYPQKLLTII